MEMTIGPKKHLLLLLLLAGLGLLGGCGRGEKEAPAKITPERLTVCTLGVAGVPVAIAQEQGLFAAQRLEVVQIASASGARAMESLFRGECDLATPSETVVVLQSFAQKEFLLLATIASSDNSLRILANRKRGIEKAEDLRGKRIFAPKGSVSQLFLAIFLAKHGMALTEVEVVSGGVADVAAALRAGELDAYCQTDVMIDRARLALGADAVLLTSPGLCLTSFNLAASNQVIGERPEVLRRFLAGLLENEKILARGLSAPVRLAFKKLELDDASVQPVFGNYHWRVGLDQVLLLSLEQEARWALEAGLVQPTPMPNYLDFIYPGLLRSLRPEAVTILN